MVDSLLVNMSRLFFLLGDLGLPHPGTGVITPGVPGVPQPPTNLPPPVGPEAPAQVGTPMWFWLIWGAFIVGLYFIFFRPQRKREKQRQEMVSAIKTGDNVLTTGGLFGRVMDVGEDCFVVEFGTNRGVRIPIAKGDVVGVREPKLTPPPKEEA